MNDLFTRQQGKRQAADVLMTFAVATKPTTSARGAEQDAARRASANARPVVRSTMLPTPYVQRSQACPCGGGCATCKTAPPIQTKLTISRPGDRYEQEADRPGHADGRACQRCRRRQ
jgi:hypothetical protein